MKRFLKRLIDRVLQRVAQHIATSLDYGRIAQSTTAHLDHERIAQSVADRLDYERITQATIDRLDYERITQATMDRLDYERIIKNTSEWLDYQRIAQAAVDCLDYERAGAALDYDRVIDSAVQRLDQVVEKKLAHIRVLQDESPGPIIPWTARYYVYWTHFIARAIADKALLQKFRCGEPLPAGYGIGVEERIVEYPWLLTNLSDKQEVLLDAGSVLNYDFIVDHPLFKRKTVHILTLAPEDKAFWKKGISYLFADLRRIPIRDDYYDT